MTFQTNKQQEIANFLHALFMVFLAMCFSCYKDSEVQIKELSENQTQQPNKFCKELYNSQR